MKNYYQLGNRLTFLYKLKERGYNVKLALLNIINDPTYKQTSEVDWKEHYESVFNEMLGSKDVPRDVLILNMEILMRWS